MALVSQLTHVQRPVNRWRTHRQPVRILLVGNNPMTLGDINDQIMKLRNATYACDFAFDTADAVRLATRHEAELIMIGAGYSQAELAEVLQKFGKDKRTRQIPMVAIGDQPMADVPCITQEELESKGLGGLIRAQVEKK